MARRSSEYIVRDIPENVSCLQNSRNCHHSVKYQPILLLTSSSLFISSTQASWYEVYTALRRHSAAVDYKILESSQITPPPSTLYSLSGGSLPRQPPKVKRLTEAVKFTLSVTHKTYELQLLDTLQCDSAAVVPIEWMRDVKRRPTATRRSCRPANILNKPSPVHILLGLNNDCILEMFEQMTLDARDLCAISRSCGRFNDLVGLIFRHRYRASSIRLTADQWPLSVCEVLFEDFGHFITSVHLDDNTIFSDIVLGLMGRHCPNLKKLTATRIDGIVSAIDGYKRLPSNKQATIAYPFGKLEEFDYSSATGEIETLPTIKLPSLRRLVIDGAILGEHVDVGAFFATNNQLKWLHLNRLHIGGQMTVILKHLHNLEELHMQKTFYCKERADSLWFFGQLKKLKKFVYHGSASCVSPILMAMHFYGVPLKQLECNMDTGRYPEMVEIFDQLDELRIFNMEQRGVELFKAFVRERDALRLIGNGLSDVDGMHGFVRIGTAAAC